MELDEEQKKGLEKLINRHDIMLFMKGNREVPQCGFSKALIEILDSIKMEYGTYDILDDMEVREGLKKYSSWPTYPQLYRKGELIGGLDVVRVLHANDQLIETLKPELKVPPANDKK